jgi:dCTP deaminase
MWQYNYVTTLSDLRADYIRALSEYEDFVPELSVASDVLAPLKGPFHLIAFPMLERENILLHSLLGHEIGHLFAFKFVTDELEAEFMAEIIPAVEELTIRQLAAQKITEDTQGGPLFFAKLKQTMLARNVGLTTTAWTRALEELLSDLVGAILFGPAALFSTLEIAQQHGFDIEPSDRNDYYPPWRLRLKKVLRLIESRFPVALAPPHNLFLDGDSSKRLSRVISRIGYLKTIVEGESPLYGDELVQLAYARVDAYEARGLQFLLDKCNLEGFAFDPTCMMSRLPPLIQRLDVGIPPNAFTDADGNERPAAFVETINAAWFHKVAAPEETGLFDEAEVEKRIKEADRRNKLTIKAIQYADLVQRVRAHGGQPSLPARLDDRGPAGEGVLTKADILFWMRKPVVTERLVITPMVQPSHDIGESAVDVRLGMEFILFRKEFFAGLDITREDTAARERKYHQYVVKSPTDTIVLQPGELVIGSTLEYVQVPRGLMCYVIGKSTWGRMGLIIATATKVDPGYRGCITLEIINEGEVPLVVTPGVPIAQLVFHRTTGDATYCGDYACAIGPEFPKFTQLRDAIAFWQRVHQDQQ